MIPKKEKKEKNETMNPWYYIDHIPYFRVTITSHTYPYLCRRRKCSVCSWLRFLLRYYPVKYKRWGRFGTIINSTVLFSGNDLLAIIHCPWDLYLNSDLVTSKQCGNKIYSVVIRRS